MNTLCISYLLLHIKPLQILWLKRIMIFFFFFFTILWIHRIPLLLISSGFIHVAAFCWWLDYARGSKQLHPYVWGFDAGYQLASFVLLHVASAFRWVYLSFSPLPFTSLLFSDICKVSSDNHFAFLHFFFLGMVLTPASCTMSQTSIHSSSGTLSIRSNLLNLFVTSTV